jgi:pilus assembly protein CpaD
MKTLDVSSFPLPLCGRGRGPLQGNGRVREPRTRRAWLPHPALRATLSRARERVLPVLLVLLLSACAPDASQYDYRQRFPIGISRHDAVAVVHDPLTNADAVSIDALGREYLRRGAGPVTVKAATTAFADDIAARLGVPVTAIVAPGDTAEIRVPVWVADLPQCGSFDHQPTPDWSNTDTANFGCATQRNIGLMIQNPADLVRPRESTGRDANRAADVLDKYRKGMPTGSAKEEAPSSTASSVGK